MLLSSCGNSENRYQMQVQVHGEYSKVYILDGETGTLYVGGDGVYGFFMANIGPIEDVPEAGDVKKHEEKEI
jgi:hypothetical protein